VTYGRQRVDVGSVLRLGAIALVGAAIAALALDNRHQVRLGYVVGEATAAAWMVIVTAAIVGVAIGWLIRYRRDRHW
jgi:uncharacterized integral membrane protein